MYSPIEFFITSNVYKQHQVIMLALILAKNEFEFVEQLRNICRNSSSPSQQSTFILANQVVTAKGHP